MKKLILGLCLALVMLLPFASAFAEDDGFIDFEPTMVNLLDFDGQTWFESGLNRALFTMLMCTDVEDVIPGAGEQIIAGDSHVLLDKDDFVYLIWNAGSNKTMLVMYVPQLDEASYTECNGDVYTWADLLESEMGATAYKNSLDDLSTACDLILEALEGVE